MRHNKNIQITNSAVQPARLQLVKPIRKTANSRRVVGLNHSVKESVRRVFLDSDFDVTSLLQVARLAGIRGTNGEPQRKVREIICEAFWELHDQKPPSGPATSMRRAA